MSAEYDVSNAFKRIENRLIDSMMRNLSHHRAEELAEGYDWEQWQVLQLRELEKYRKENPALFAGDFDSINKRIDGAFHGAYQDAGNEAEAKILKEIKAGNFTPQAKPIEGDFFGLNASRLEHLVQATRQDFVRGEWSVLRQANDEYRRIIFDAQMYSASGATYEQAVDMATKDFLKNGIQSITYKNGAKHTIQDYSRMAIRTGQKRAYLMGEGDAADKYGIHTVRVNKRLDACPLCVKWLGKVLVDDVYAGGTDKEAKDAGVPLLSEAMAEGFLHPNCKDIYTLYIEGVSKPAEPWSKEEIQEIADKYNVEQAAQRAEDMKESYDRMAKYSLDPINKERYEARALEWANRASMIGKVAAPVAPAAPAVVEYTTDVNGKAYTTKQLSKPVSVNKAIPFEQKLTPSLADYQKEIKALQKAKAGDDVIKPLLEQAVQKADDDIAALKASGASKQKVGGISTKKSFLTKEITKIDLKAEIADLETAYNDAVAAKAANMPADATYSGIWKQDVKLSEFATYEPKVAAKEQYYIDKIQEFENKGLSYGMTQSEVDAKVAELGDHLTNLYDFQLQGEAYKNAAEALENDIIQAQGALDAKKDELFKVEHPKQWAKQHANNAGVITQERRDNAIWAQSVPETEKTLMPAYNDTWNKATAPEKAAAIEYTGSYHKFNEPLRGIEYGSNAFKGVGNTDLNASYANNGNALNALTDLLNKAALPEDQWFQRGIHYGGADKFLGIDMNLIMNGTEAELQNALLDKVVTEYGFMSAGSAKGDGFSNMPIMINIFAPQGTKGLYLEPISQFSGIGETETLFQQGTQMRIVKVERNKGTIWLDVDIVRQDAQQRYIP